MGGLLPIPPSSAYCVQRSDSISSAAARKRRIATSPASRRPSCARAEDAFANKPAPTVAAPPASKPLFIKERRSTERFVLFTGFSIVVLPDLIRVKICISRSRDTNARLGAELERCCQGIVILNVIYRRNCHKSLRDIILDQLRFKLGERKSHSI